jgi:FkbM family methyltransferase
MNSLLATLRNIVKHPLNKNDRLRALARYLRWQLGSRLVPGAVVVPFIGNTSLIVSRGMAAATQQIYAGLSDFSECSLLLHLLREDQLFVDVGANVGVYTVLAAGVVGAQVVCIEPIPRTFQRLSANLRVNDIVDKVVSHNIGLGRQEGVLRFTVELDAMNHVVKDDTWTGPSMEVQVSTLDSILKGRTPTLIKLDVEGWEGEVLAGASSTLSCASLLGWIVEMNSSDAAFSPNELAVHECLLRNGFKPHAYDPLTRTLTMLPSKNLETVNTLYLRSADQIRSLVASAPAFTVNGRSC